MFVLCLLGVGFCASPISCSSSRSGGGRSVDHRQEVGALKNAEKAGLGDGIVTRRVDRYFCGATVQYIFLLVFDIASITLLTTYEGFNTVMVFLPETCPMGAGVS